MAISAAPHTRNPRHSKAQARRAGELCALPHVARFQAANQAYAAAFATGNCPIRIQDTYYVQGAA